MLVHDVEILDKNNLNIVKRKSKKTQILLYDTQRRVDDFINKIKYRRNGEYEDIPHFVVSKLGMVYQIFDSNHSSKTFDNPQVDKKQIKIAIENLGWLNKNTITGVLNNWIGYRIGRNHISEIGETIIFGTNTTIPNYKQYLSYVITYVINMESSNKPYHLTDILKMYLISRELYVNPTSLVFIQI